MVNETNFLVKQSGKINVYPLKDFPNFTLNHEEFVKKIGDVSKLVWVIPVFLLISMFAGLLTYYFLLRGLHVLALGLLLFLVALTAQKKLDFLSSSRIALHSMTLPILVEVIVSLAGITIPFGYWFMLLNLLIAGAALWSVSFAKEAPSNKIADKAD